MTLGAPHEGLHQKGMETQQDHKTFPLWCLQLQQTYHVLSNTLATFFQYLLDYTVLA